MAGPLLLYAETGHAGAVTALLCHSEVARSGHETAQFVPQREPDRHPEDSRLLGQGRLRLARISANCVLAVLCLGRQARGGGAVAHVAKQHSSTSATAKPRSSSGSSAFRSSPTIRPAPCFYHSRLPGSGQPGPDPVLRTAGWQSAFRRSRAHRPRAALRAPAPPGRPLTAGSRSERTKAAFRRLVGWARRDWLRAHRSVGQCLCWRRPIPSQMHVPTLQ